MLKAVKDLTITILLVDDMEAMKEFYRTLFPFEIRGEHEDGLSFKPPGSTLFSLRRRTRDYDGKGPRHEAPGVQLAFASNLMKLKSATRSC